MTDEPRLRLKTKVAFGSGAAAEAALGIAFNNFNLYYYATVLGLPGTLCGLAVTIALVLDAISDPAIGSLSDRWRSKLGRRHPFLYASVVPIAVCFYCIYSPPAGLRGIPLFVWFTTFTVLLRQALTLYHVPHSALGAELSRDYRERSVVMGHNAIFGMLGGVATFFFSWTWLQRAPGGRDAAANYSVLGLAVGVFAALVVLASAYYTRDRIPFIAQPAAGTPRFSARVLWQEMRGCLSNANYLALMIGLILLSATLGVRETLGTHVNLFFWELDEGRIRYFGLATPPAFVLAFFLTPVLHARFEKRGTIIATVVMLIVASTLPIILRLVGALPPIGSRELFFVLAAFVFLFYLSSAILTITVMSALADIADEHELTTGRRQEGVFFAARTFFAKLVSAVGHLVGGVALDLIAFPTGAKPGEVPADTVLALGLIDGPVTAVPAIAAVFFYARYRIDRARHAEIQAALDARRRA